jgi:pyridoxine 5-phosphate synthase
LRAARIVVSLFIDPQPEQVSASAELGADFIELHTGTYANATASADVADSLRALQDAAAQARELNLGLNAGHGLTTLNVGPVAALPGLHELNIGHSIVARAVFVGMTEAVREMKAAIERAQ